KAASRETAAAATNRVRLRRAADLNVGSPHDHARSERRTTRALAIPAVAVQCRDGRACTCVANGSACAATKEWKDHAAVYLEVSRRKLTPTSSSGSASQRTSRR